MSGLTPNAMSKLTDLYKTSTDAEKNIFAEVVNETLQGESKDTPDSTAQDISPEDPPRKGEFVRYSKQQKQPVKKLYGILSDFELIHLGRQGVISPFSKNLYEGTSEAPKIHYGLDRYGYVIRSSNICYDMDSAEEKTLAPKNPPKFEVQKLTSSEIAIPPGANYVFISIESLNIPQGIIVNPYQLGVYSQSGLHVQGERLVGPYRGSYPMVVTNLNKNKQVILYVGEGIVGLEFHRPFCLTREMFEKSR